METQEMVTFGQKNLKQGKHEVRAIVAHELAHSWFGDTATPTDWRDVWMNEGFAMYYQAKFEVHRGWSSWASNVRLWKEWDGYLRYKYGPPGAYHRDAFASSNVYYCPARMLDRLSTKVGPHKFARLVRRWVASHADSNVSREKFQAWWEARTGLDLTNFLDKWLNSTTAPK
jgi:aminopeptidase N